MTQRTKFSLVVLVLLAGILFALKFVIRPSLVLGASMEPTLRPWDYCLSLRVYRFEPRRGDIVTFRTADDPPLYLVKRVIALPGETVAIERGIVKIDGQALAEPYTTINPSWELEPVAVPAGKVFVLGDNRDVARAESVHGLVAARLVVARMVWHWRWRR